MKENNTKFIASVLIAVGILVFVSILFLKNKTIPLSQKESVSEQISQVSNKKNVVINLVVENKNIHVVVPYGSSLYDALVIAQQNGQINFSGKSYPSLGFFVTDIDALHSGGGKNLIYYINGAEAQVGISSYVPADGDIISWKLE